MHTDEVSINGRISGNIGESDDMLVFAPVREGEGEPGKDRADKADAGKTILKLKAAGINTEDGLKHTSNKTGFYLEILGDYCAAQPDKLKALEDALEKEDWYNYRILIHSIKSTSKTIGAAKVAKPAEKLEEAASVGDGVYVKKRHPGFVQLYGEQVRLIGDCIK